MKTAKRKLIEVAMPLAAINDAAAYDKMPGIGPHPKGIHHWWAGLPLPAARAVILASLLDDPSEDPAFKGKSEKVINNERQRLFNLIRDSVEKKPHERPDAFERLRKEIVERVGTDLPTLIDPFSGKGSIPLEGLRLGLPTIANDLNPVASMICRAVLEIIPRFGMALAGSSGKKPGTKGEASKKSEYKSTLASDVARYGDHLLAEARKRLEALYPEVTLPKANGGGTAKAIAWIWARTVQCPNPKCRCQMPLVKSFVLAKKKGKEVRIEPTVLTKGSKAKIQFSIKENVPGGVRTSKNGRGAKFGCLACGSPSEDGYIKEQGRQGKIDVELIAIVADGPKGRVYLAPSEEHSRAAVACTPDWIPDEELAYDPRNIWCTQYGLTKFGDLFTKRQLVALGAFSDGLKAVRKMACADAKKRGLPDDGVSLEDGGLGASAYADAVAVLLAFNIDRCTDFNNSLCRWSSSNEKVMNLFGRQAIPMMWDFAEANIVGDSVGSWSTCLSYLCKCVDVVAVSTNTHCATVRNGDASTVKGPKGSLLVSTDPPYYDNIGYADLSDFFYVWMRHSLKAVLPKFMATIKVPKDAELVATPYRFGGDKAKAMNHFESGFTRTFSNLREQLDPRFPMTVFYAFKETDSDDDGDDASEDGEPKPSSAAGWETLLESIISAGFTITGTWPIRASQKWRMVAMGTNALASYIVIVCRPRASAAPSVSRKDFLSELRLEVTKAVRRLTANGIAPVDLDQAAMGSGMEVFSKYRSVMDASGGRMGVGDALTEIARVIDACLSEHDSEIDNESRWAVSWYEAVGMEKGEYDDAEKKARPKGVTVQGLEKSGIVHAKASKVRLIARSELKPPGSAERRGEGTIWEVTQQLVKALDERGESAVAELIRELGDDAEKAKDMAYRLFKIAEKKGWAEEARAYNSLVVAWSEITKIAA